MQPETVDRQLPAEIAFLARHGVPAGRLAEAAALGAAWDVPADAALIRSGLLAECEFYRALAAETGLPFAGGPLPVHPRARLPEAVLAGLVPLATGDDARPGYAYAPHGRDVAEILARRAGLPAGFSITTPGAIRDSVIAARGSHVAALAADGLAARHPEFSYRGGASRLQLGLAYLAGLGSGLLSAWAPAESWACASIVLGGAFLGSTALRLAAALERVPVEPARPPPRIPDRDLPVYTVLIALHREARVVPRLLRAVAAIDYPAAKLDVKIVIEAGDAETAQALSSAPLPGFAEVIVAPEGEPRTKPRALNVALPLARGEFVTVYDAEDVPEPGQLRLAVSFFRRSPPEVACLQARLVIDNAHDGWLTRMFAIEYAALFDVTNPALARFDLPVPLGGTSNHFRRSVLQALGGWDAWNVTEDADLGFRLAAAGYRVADLPSATLEEAPHHLGAWLRQRTRWMKGFLQVSVTHSRRPWETLRRLGPLRAFGAWAMSFGTVASALGFPAFMVLAADALVTGRLLAADTPLAIASASVGATLFAAGLLAITIPPLEGVRRRGWSSLLPLVALMPVYYCLVSLAAWRGLLEFVLEPQRWNKTEHGLARTSRAGLLP
ncbi:glycosyltransferase [Enterovirga sp. DB1703]|uniref:Glycosyltransferase n=1 Tax=Enterovirga aerilata TaxID=2730920 RepID=A0A849I252_9HYPH|nr:glycosyltransferase [Enterovirga sp. DB1703]NNM71694.1 glycosyltransferase [Enterovirga sp. DB1703]